MKRLIFMLAALLHSCHLVSAGNNDSSTDTGDQQRRIQVTKPKEASWWQRGMRWVVGGLGFGYYTAKQVLPDFVQTGIGYVTKPITYCVHKLTGWNDWMDILSAEDSLLQNFIAKIVIAKGCGFADERASKEVALIARILKLSKFYVQAKQSTSPDKNDRRMDTKDRKELDDKTAALYSSLTTPKSLAISMVGTLAKELILKRKLLEQWRPDINKEFVEFATGAGLKTITKKVVKALPVLLVLVLQKDETLKQATTDSSWFANFDMKKLEKNVIFGTEMAQGYNWYNRIKKELKKDQMKQKRKKMKEDREKRKHMPIAEIKLPETTGVTPEAPPTLTEKVISSARESLNMWVAVMLGVILLGLLICSYCSGMIKPPTSAFPDQIGEKKVDVFIAKDIRNIDDEMKVAEMV